MWTNQHCDLIWSNAGSQKVEPWFTVPVLVSVGVVCKNIQGAPSTTVHYHNVVNNTFFWLEAIASTHADTVIVIQRVMTVTDTIRPLKTTWEYYNLSAIRSNPTTQSTSLFVILFLLPLFILSTTSKHSDQTWNIIFSCENSWLWFCQMAAQIYVIRQKKCLWACGEVHVGQIRAGLYFFTLHKLTCKCHCINELKGLDVVDVRPG